MSVAYYGATEQLLAAMFPQKDSHVRLYRQWLYLYRQGLVDKAGISLCGRLKGEFFKHGRVF